MHLSYCLRWNFPPESTGTRKEDPKSVDTGEELFQTPQYSTQHGPVTSAIGLFSLFVSWQIQYLGSVLFLEFQVSKNLCSMAPATAMFDVKVCF